nr:radical SAM family heme chaperone HemW [bacterium]
MPLGIYVHLPFCRARCAYCDFYSNAAMDKGCMQAYIRHVIREVDLWAARADGMPVATVYLGGGTPSYLPIEGIEELLAAIRRAFLLEKDAEVTLEANPDSVTEQKLDRWRAAGVNRLSLGVQAAQDHLLAVLGRVHTVGQAERAIRQARHAGFDNLSLDAMLGLPGQTMGDWLETLDFIAQARHVSCYALEVYPKTELGRRIAEGQLILPDEDTVVDMMHACTKKMAAYGLARYEVSNYARQGYASRHNQNYWLRGDYIGLGAGAHGFFQGVRYENAVDLAHYACCLRKNRLPCGPGQRIFGLEAAQEELMLGLRRVQGISRADFERRYGVPAISQTLEKRLLSYGVLEPDTACLRLSEKGFDLMNSVLVEVLNALEQGLIHRA